MNRPGEVHGLSDEQIAAALRGARNKLESLRRKLCEPLAVIGIGCRFPQASGPHEFWELLQRGGCAITETPHDRWAASLRAAGDKQPGRVTANRGGFLEQIERFDAQFFGISGREAESMDPQQRLLLEVAWETMEHAGLDPDRFRGSRTGVFVGICSNDYLHRLAARQRAEIDAYLGTGNSHGVAAGRLSYFMNWQGPSVAVDTACSSSLTAIHLAARSLRFDDCEMALAAGVNVILEPELSIALSQAGMLSPTGLCHTFDSAADGFVRGEGCGAVLLKRLSRALADGDRIFCLLRGSACNQDGRSNGLTAPNGVSQQAVIRAALADANLASDDIDYLEAHGTGTPLGDPVELNALAAVFAVDRNPQLPLRVGSVKTNIGHLEGAAGIAGFIKVALSLYHEQLPAHLHLHSGSPHADWSLPIVVPPSTIPWRRGQRIRCAGVSSFGFGGTNAHVVLEEAAPIPAAVDAAAEMRGAQRLFTASAKTPSALREVAARHAATIQVNARLADLCHTANAGRAHFEHRLAVVVETTEQLAGELRHFAAAGSSAQGYIGSAENEFAVHWLFGDAIAAYASAGRNLYESHPTFRTALDRCRAACASLSLRPLEDMLWKDPTPGNNRHDILPAFFCLQVATAQLWRSWGITPKVILGHGVGEYAAACAAGVFTMEEGLRLAVRHAERQRASGNGEGQCSTLSAVDARTRYMAPNCSYVSTSNGDGHVALAEYWADRPLQPNPSSFELAVRRVIAQSGVNLFLEMGIANSGFAQPGWTLLPGLTDPDNEWGTIVDNLAQMYAQGATVDWQNFEHGSGRRVSLPTYPFERKPYLVQPRSANLQATPIAVDARRVHPLLGMRLDLGGREVVFETDLIRLPYLADHRIGLSQVFPAAGFMELAMAAGAQVAGEPLDVIDLNIQSPISWNHGESCRVQVIVTPGADFHECRILRRDEDLWRTAAECRLTPSLPGTSPSEQAWNGQLDGIELDVEQHYRRCQEAGIGYGPSFRGVNKLLAKDREAWGEVGVPENLSLAGYLLHPALLDACLQTTAAALGDRCMQIWLPVRAARYHLSRLPATDTRLRTNVRIVVSDDDDSISADLRIGDADGRLLAAIEGLLLKPTGRVVEASGSDPNAKPDIAVEVLSASPSAARARLQEYVYSRLCEVLHMAAEEIPVDKPLNTLGLDSMMAFELRDQLERDLRISVPFEVLLQDRSPAEFVDMLLKKLQAAQHTKDASGVAAEVVPQESWIEGAI